MTDEKPASNPFQKLGLFAEHDRERDRILKHAEKLRELQPDMDETLSIVGALMSAVISLRVENRDLHRRIDAIDRLHEIP